MSQSVSSKSPNSQDQILAQLLNDAMEALQEGRQVDVEALAAQWPAQADELRRLVPVMHTCAQISGGTESSVLQFGHPEFGTLGDFLIERELGRGGMGIVYEAQQISLRRRVALKVLPFAAVLDSRRLRRFQNEAQAAALLHHPQIVPVYSVGCDRGVHYYAMQLVEGPTLAHVICDLRSQDGLDPPPPELAVTRPPVTVAGTDDVQTRPAVPSSPAGQDAAAWEKRKSSPQTTLPQGILSTAHSHRSTAFIQAAVQLGIDVAEALDYAHLEGILHRDIKPGNLLLDERGRVWVTDFGLARIEADPSLTLAGDFVGTLRYMSPEQALGNLAAVDGRTDVYALGATLYELLTLEPVFDGANKQTLLRQIAFEEPRPPRQLERGLPFELETILLKTLAKNPDERYASAGALADDLRRFLEQKPIQARRPTLMDRATKWALRNRRLVLASGIGLLLIVVTMAVAGLLIWNEQHKTQHALAAAITEKKRAVEQAAISEAVNAFLLDDLLGQADVSNQLGTEDSPDPNVKVRTLLDRASQAIEGKFANQPRLEAQIRKTMGSAYLGLGLFPQAELHLDRACQLRRAQLGAEHPDTLAALSTLAKLYQAQSRFAEAETLCTQALEIQRRVLGPEHPDTLASMNNLASLRLDQARHSEAESLSTQCQEITRRVLGPEHPDTLTSMNNLAGLYWALNELEKSIPLFEETLDLQKKILGKDNPQTLLTAANLGVNYKDAGRLDEALPLLEAGYRAAKDYPSLRWVGVQLLDGYVQAQRAEQAEVLAQQLLTRTRATLPQENVQLASTLAKIAQSLLQLRAWTKAEPMLRECLTIREQREQDAWTTSNTRSMLGAALLGQQKYADAEPLLVQGYEGMKQREDQIPAKGKVRLVESLERLVQLYEAMEKPDEAAKWRSELEATQQRLASTAN